MRFHSGMGTLVACAILLPSAVAAAGTIRFEAKSAGRVAGVYRNDGVIVRFESVRARNRRDAVVRIASQRGEPILELLASNNTGTASLRVRGGLATYRLEAGTAAGGREPRVTKSGKAGVIEDLLRSDEIQALPALSHTLGVRYGITGKSHPASKPLHDLALRVARARMARTHEVFIAPGGTEGDLFERRCRHAQDGEFCASNVACTTATGAPGTRDLCCNAHDCTEACSTCQASPPEGIACDVVEQDPRHDPCPGCFGMCGANCTCWPWVCGDCCCNEGCAAHDSACGRCSLSDPWDCARCMLLDAGVPLFECKHCTVSCNDEPSQPPPGNSVQNDALCARPNTDGLECGGSKSASTYVLFCCKRGKCDDPCGTGGVKAPP